MVEGLELRQLVPNNEVENEVEFEQPPSAIEAVSVSERWPYTGIVLATISSLFFSLCSLIVKWMIHVDPMELAVCRFVGVLLPAIPIIIYHNAAVFPEGKRLILLLRSFLGCTGLILTFYAVRLMPLADASVIVFSVPVFVAVFAYLFLNEPCGLFNIITIGLTLLGVVLITRPTFLFSHAFESAAVEEENYHRAWGAMAAFSSTLFGAGVFVLLRTLKSLNFATVMANFGAFALVETTAASWYLGVLCWPKCGLERLYMILLAVFSFLGQILLTLSLQMENAGPVAIARSSDIVFAFIWQILFFKDVPSVFSLLGALLVTSSVIMTALRKWVLTLPENTPLRIRLNILTK